MVMVPRVPSDLQPTPLILPNVQYVTLFCDQRQVCTVSLNLYHAFEINLHQIKSQNLIRVLKHSVLHK